MRVQPQMYTGRDTKMCAGRHEDFNAYEVQPATYIDEKIGPADR
jgi:hypothetical protein